MKGMSYRTKSLSYGGSMGGMSMGKGKGGSAGNGTHTEAHKKAISEGLIAHHKQAWSAPKATERHRGKGGAMSMGKGRHYGKASGPPPQASYNAYNGMGKGMSYRGKRGGRASA